MAVQRLFQDEPRSPVQFSSSKVKNKNEPRSPEAKNIKSALSTIAQSNAHRRLAFDEPQNSTKRELSPGAGDASPLPKKQKLDADLSQLELPPAPKKGPPPTPRKAVSTFSRNNAPKPLSIFKSLLQQEKSKMITYNQQNVAIEFLDSGSYMNVYVPSAKQPIVAGQENHQLVFKLFQDKFGGAERFLQRCMTTSLQYYDAAIEADLAVAAIYNAKTAQTDGFYIQERIAAPIDVLNQKHLDQVHHFFLVFLQNKETLLLDLLPDNFRDDGVVKLIDFVEENDDDQWDIYIKQAVKMWCKLYIEKTSAHREEAKAFIQLFTQDFENYGYKKDWNAEILEELFKFETFHNRD